MRDALKILWVAVKSQERPLAMRVSQGLYDQMNAWIAGYTADGKTLPDNWQDGACPELAELCALWTAYSEASKAYA